MNSRHAIAPVSTALALSVAALLAGGCGDVTGVELGDFRCISTPCEANFGELNVNRPGQTAKVIVENIGGGDLNIEEIYLEGTSANVAFSDVTVIFVGDQTGFDWRVDGDGHAFEATVPYVLSPSERLEIEVEFTPNGDGHGCPGEVGGGGAVHCGDIVFVSNDVDNDDRTIRAPVLLSIGDTRMEVNPTTLSYAPAQLVDAGAGTYAQQTRTFTVQNLGSGNMTLQNIDPDTEEIRIEDQSGASLPIVLIGGAERVFDAVWTPTSGDPLSAQITVRSNAIEGSTRVILVDSAGEDEADIDVEPCAFHFPETAVGETSEILFDVTNTGSAGMEWQVAFTGIRPSEARDDFDILSATDEPAMGEQDTLAPSQTRTLKAVYSPTEARSVVGAVRFAGDFGPSFECPLSAGEAIPVAEVAPAQLFWGGISSGESDTRSFVVYNIGRAELQVDLIDKAGDAAGEWEVDSLAAGGFTVPAGQSRRVEVTYTRATEDLPAQDTATLTVRHDGNALGLTQVFLTATHGEQYLPPSCAMAASPDAPYAVGQTLTLDASGSTLNAGDWATNQFQWNLERAAGSSANLSGEFGSAVTLDFDVPGTYTVGLIATALIETTQVSCEITRTFAVEE